MPNYNLPPGCTDFDIDRAAGITTVCPECGREVYKDDLVKDFDFVCRSCARGIELADRDDRDID